MISERGKAWRSGIVCEVCRAWGEGMELIYMGEVGVGARGVEFEVWERRRKE